MSWDPDAEMLPAPLPDAVSPVVIAMAFAVPLLLLARLFSPFG
jgi:hypothetical protein